MNRLLKLFMVPVIAFASIVTTLSMTGCASGGYKLTRDLSGWVNKQHIIVRILLYIIGGIAWAITLLIDFVIFNTIDFWEGKVSQGDYQFEGQDKMYFVKHRINDQNLKSSHIEIKDIDGNFIKSLAFKEISGGNIEVYEDGVLKGKTESLNGLTVFNRFNEAGKSESLEIIPTFMSEDALLAKR